MITTSSSKEGVCMRDMADSHTTAQQISGSNQSQLALRLCKWQDRRMNDTFAVLIYFPIAPFSWTSFSSPSIEPSELPFLRIEILLSQCNYICQTHLPVCPKTVSVIPLLVAEIVPEICVVTAMEPYLEELLIILLIFFSNLQSHINSRILNICICLHLWQLCSETSLPLCWI